MVSLIDFIPEGSIIIIRLRAGPFQGLTKQCSHFSNNKTTKIQSNIYTHHQFQFLRELNTTQIILLGNLK